MFPEGTQPVAGRWRATTGLQFNKRMHPGGRASGASLPSGTPRDISPGYFAGFTQRSSPIKILVRSEPGFDLSSMEPA